MELIEGQDAPAPPERETWVAAPPSAAGAGRTPLLWTVFVLGWLPVLVLVVWWLPQERFRLLHYAVILVELAALACLYLWLTLRGALSAADLTPVGPSPAVVHRRQRLLAAMAALIVALVLIAPAGGVWWLVMYPIVAAGLALPVRQAALASAGLVALGMAIAWLVASRIEAELLVGIGFGAGAIVIRQLTITVGELRAAREELAHLAVAKERLRFARDLHDLLGHSLSVIVLKSELAGRLLPSAPERSAVEIGDIERAAREALRHVRAVVAGYRKPTLQTELVAARELLAAAGIAPLVDHAAGPLPPELDELLAWTVREGVTNVIRHSRARRCAIRLDRRGDLLCAEVADDGSGAGDVSLAGGNGLAGLAERAAAHGGRLQAGPLPSGGFALRLEAPASAARRSAVA